jgi:hypothetical protein
MILFFRISPALTSARGDGDDDRDLFSGMGGGMRFEVSNGSLGCLFVAAGAAERRERTKGLTVKSGRTFPLEEDSLAAFGVASSGGAIQSVAAGRAFSLALGATLFVVGNLSMITGELIIRM